MKARIVFDLDGTLIDSAPDIHGVANDLLAAHGRQITLAQTHDFIGNGVAVFVQKMRAACGLPDDLQEPLTRAFKASYLTAVHKTVPYPGVVPALEALRAQGHALGICTNKPIAPCMAVLNHLDLGRLFDTFWGGDSLPVNKPDPAPLHAAFDALGQGPRIYVGDSDVDAETAVRADVPFILFTQGYRKRPVAQMSHDVAFEDFAALPQVVAAQLAL